MPVDGTDLRILESSPFNPLLFSQNLGGPGLRYEIGVILIVFAATPTEQGRRPDPGNDM